MLFQVFFYYKYWKNIDKNIKSSVLLIAQPWAGVITQILQSECSQCRKPLHIQQNMVHTLGCRTNLEKLNLNSLPKSRIFKQCELLWVQIILPENKGKLLLGTCYRPPSSTLGFDEALSFSINRVLLSSQSIKPSSFFEILILEFPAQFPTKDANPLIFDNHSSTVLNIIESVGMAQIVSFPTRRNPHGDNTMLDLILCNGTGHKTYIKHLASVTATMIQSSFKFFHHPAARFHLFHQFYKADTQDFQRTLEYIPWELFSNVSDIAKTWDNFTSLIHATVKVVPIASFKGHRQSP